MADVFSRKKRSQIMSRVKGRGNRATEGKLIELLRANRIPGWRRNYHLVGRPDLVFPRYKVSLFVDGCFWHACPEHGSTPTSNVDFWDEKLRKNKARDVKVGRALRARGWKVVRIWQHELRRPAHVAKKILRVLRRTG